MDQPVPAENSSVATAALNVNLLREGAYITPIPIHDNLLRLIGLVTTHWGAFETRVDKMLAALLKSANREEPGWDRLGFKRRKTLFVELVKSYVAPSNSFAAECFLKVMGTAADLYWRRNLVTHGHYHVTFPAAGQGAPFFWAEGKHNGRDVRVDISGPTLEKLWHDIAHVTGSLTHTFMLVGQLEAWPPTWSDTNLLQAAGVSSRPTPPISGTDQFQP